MSRSSRASVRVLVASLALAAGALATPAPARAQRTGTPPVGVGKTIGELGLGFGLMPIGFLAGGLASRAVAWKLGADDDRASRVAYAGAYTGAALATAAGPTLVGTRGRVSGSYLGALGGTVVGGAASVLLVRLERLHGDAPCRLTCKASAVLVFLLPSIGATAGFDASRRWRR